MRAEVPTDAHGDDEAGHVATDRQRAPTPRCQLVELSIRDFAIVEALRIEWAPGLVVLSGETGAGKSIIIDALGAAIGDRADPLWIRTGSERASVEAMFDVPPEAARDLAGFLLENDLPVDEGLILAREVMSGRSVSRVNGRAVAVGLVQRLAEQLVDIHSQASHVSLTRSRGHLGVLDRYARTGTLRDAMASAARSLTALRREIRSIEEGDREVQREATLLRHEVADIDSAGVQAGEEEELFARRSRLKNTLRLRQLTTAAHDALHGGDESPGGVGLLESAAIHLAEIRSLDPRFEGREERLTELIEEAEDLSRALSSYAESLDDDPAALDTIEERLLRLAELKRKYGNTLADVLAYSEGARRRLDQIEHRDERLDDLRSAAHEQIDEAARAAVVLSATRSSAARDLEVLVENELDGLGMAGSRFAVSMVQTDDSKGLPLSDGRVVAFDEGGIDQVEFLISVNPGEDPRSLARIASGGELARFMLALKSVLSEVDETPVLVFDELDQGVGGRMGHVIGEKLWRLARSHHVICVTHLPQVAAYADAHYVVAKSVKDGRTVTSVNRVDGEARADEIAAMLAGASAGPAARRSADELLRRASDWKATSS
ncbi:MAG: recN [Chloroflexi bacterium]|nr:recN [Chloroflexota bacterium]